MEFYKKYRPVSFGGILGQPEAIKSLTAMVQKKSIPHAVLLTGGSGCGKTTIARILVKELGCGEHDYQEINCADFRGIDLVRDIRQRMSLSPISGSCRIWVLDEAHKLTGDAQTAFLKMLEDTPSHVYFFLATTDPGKLLRTLVTRCTEIKVKPLSAKLMESLVNDVAKKEKIKITNDVVLKLVDVADGSARKALVLLNQIHHLKSEEEQLELLQSADSKRQAVDIARALMNPRGTWVDLAKILKEVEDEPETIRRLILAYAGNVLLGGGKLASRAFLIIRIFESNWFDSGKPGMIASCYEVFHEKN